MALMAKSDGNEVLVARDDLEAGNGTEKGTRSVAEDELTRRTKQVQHLAKSYSRNSLDDLNPCLAQPDSPLNPNSANFDSLEWAKALVELYRRHGITLRSAGVCFNNLTVFGFSGLSDYQKTVGNVWLSAASFMRRWTGYKRSRINILHRFDGVLQAGQMLVVLGPPGSGCSTLLKTIAGEMRGISTGEMSSAHRGEALYNAEVDTHFPHLTVGDTLSFAARARLPRPLPQGCGMLDFALHLRDTVMAMFGILHTLNTRVGDDFVRGVSGGERKRVSIAEAALSGAPLQCWDNSTRGLDSLNAVEFCRTLRLQADIFNITSCVSMYQAPQSAYDVFDKVVVLYEGRQIYFGPVEEAKDYFVNLGFECPVRQTTPDFLTSMTSPSERVVRASMRHKVPRTPDEFAAVWRASAQYAALQVEINQYKDQYHPHGADAEAFRASKKAQQAKGQHATSPYMLSYSQQVKLCLWRCWRRLASDPSIFIGSLVSNFITALIVSSIFYNLDDNASNFFKRGSLLFCACMMSAMSSVLEIVSLYAQRRIVEKHKRYALYHPSAEAIASLISDLPYKILNTLIVNITLYFMTNLRREFSSFCFFALFSFSTALVMSMVFRTIASASRTLFQALVPASVLVIAFITFTGFVVPQKYMLGWCKWISYINPLGYSFEAFMANEFHGRQFKCTQYVPSATPPEPSLAGALAKYANLGSQNRICNAIGATAGQDFVSGDVYIKSSYGYAWANRWVDFGILVAFIAFFLMCYLVAAELVSEKVSEAEVLIFPRGHRTVRHNKHSDVESEMSKPSSISMAGETACGSKKDSPLQHQTSVYHWQDLCYDVKTKQGLRRLLNNVDGWVKPGTLTALMGASGAGKTTLLDCLSDRASIGIVSGEVLVNGKPRDLSFQRKTGYVLQQDIHLHTTTVREALNFSALLRQPASTPRREKLAYVDEVIELLDMEDYADAIIGVPGEGLNVEQRKRLTIAVELAAKPPLLLFVDEPTSGLDSQTSCAILDLLEKLTKAGQAVLCTIHQPSAMLFQRFDRLLLLAKEGRPVYFGEIGDNSSTLIRYFESNGAKACPADANPAEWMLQVIGAAPRSTSDTDWPQVWRSSPNYRDVQAELRKLKENQGDGDVVKCPASNGPEFAASFFTQLKENLVRIFQQYWRSPVYIFAKMALCTVNALFIGFVFFRAPNSIQGLQNQMFAIFLLLSIFSQIAQQYMPQFIVQRTLYEARERPSKTYSWKVFMLAQIIVEVAWSALISVFMYTTWYFPVGLYHNGGDATAERSVLMFLYVLSFLLFTSSFSILLIAGFETAEAGGNLANALFSLCLYFCGVLSSPSSLPGFWQFMYRVSPMTYMISGILSTGLGNAKVQCSDNEILKLQPPANQTCGEFLHPYDEIFGGHIQNPGDSNMCLYCPIESSNTFLAGIGSHYSERWRNYGILWAYIIFNSFAALFIYWLARVPKNKKNKVRKQAALS